MKAGWVLTGDKYGPPGYEIYEQSTYGQEEQAESMRDENKPTEEADEQQLKAAITFGVRDFEDCLAIFSIKTEGGVVIYKIEHAGRQAKIPPIELYLIIEESPWVAAGKQNSPPCEEEQYSAPDAQEEEAEIMGDDHIEEAEEAS